MVMLKKKQKPVKNKRVRGTTLKIGNDESTEESKTVKKKKAALGRKYQESCIKYRYIAVNLNSGNDT